MSLPDAVTIAQAASVLRVEKPRIHQLLRDGVLTGPERGSGRAPRNAPRVWQRSLDAEVRRRQNAANQAAASPPKVSKQSARQRSAQSQPNLPGAAAFDSAAGRAAAQQMKVALDLAREALRAERAQTRKITRVLADTVALLQEQQRLADQADTVADGYANALTQLLSPTDTSTA